ncbi:MAG: hypothetical protein J0L93_05105 [Deltaproteobacteria bacterium]|nr:hypothetical protein [Deltaproteobacteria bacterium]
MGDGAKDISPSSSLLADWSYHQAKSYIRVLSLAFMGGMILCALFDWIFFANFSRYTPFRFIPITFGVLSLVATEFRPSKSWQIKILNSILLSSTALVLNLLYHFYLLRAPSSDFNIVFYGNLLIAFFSIFPLNRFLIPQLLVVLSSLASAFSLSILFPQLRDQFHLIMICQLSTLILSFYLRQEFANELAEKFRTLQNIAPRRVARAITIGDKSESFDPRMRPTICLCSDWRNYQALASRVNAETISRLFEDFYGSVKQALEVFVPDGSYFFEWTADQVFITFYDPKDDLLAAMKRAVAFTEFYCGPLLENGRKNLKLKINYDVGLSSGVGFLGLQGPKGFKKTTISAEHAGIAKRLETEAKSLRSDNLSDENPIVVIDKNTANLMKELHLVSDARLEKFESDNKDLKSKEIYRWKYDFSAIKLIKFETKDEENIFAEQGALKKSVFSSWNNLMETLSLQSKNSTKK